MTNAERSFDVLVIGGGLAALRAAISARQAGASVAIATKGRLGRSGGSATTTGGYAAVLGEYETGDDIAVHAEDTLKGGARMADPELVRILVREAPERLRDLAGLGGAILMENGRYRLAPGGDHSFARTVVPVHHVGTDFTLPMAEHAQRAGCLTFELTMAVELLTDAKGVSGSVLVDLDRGGAWVAQAGTIVLATGGCGRLFALTSNPRDVTGDGYALALRAGAELRDMEFIQFYPWRCIDPFRNTRIAIQPSTFVYGGRLFNSRDERFMERYDPERLEATTRDIAARAIADQARLGLAVDGGVRLDLAALDAETFQRSNPKASAALQRQGIDYRTYPFIVAPEAHYFMGGIRIDSWGRSSVPGLFAAGEVAGGIHGGNRIGNNALPETQVFGERAGRVAATQARQDRHPPPLPGEWSDRVAALGGGPSAADEIDELRKTLQSQMWSALGPLRNRDGIDAGMAATELIESRRRGVTPVDPIELRDWVELGFMTAVARSCLSAARLREESRGAHVRLDFPAPDPAWQRTIVVRSGDDGGLDLRGVSPDEQPSVLVPSSGHESGDQ
jgi:succinate dehydrogenase/fumarate reductase flavoprotein subunit